MKRHPHHAIARNTDPATSHKAAKTVPTKTHALLVLDILAGQPRGATDKDIVRLAHKSNPMASDSSLRTRRSELVTLGLVHQVGVWEPPFGTACIIWGLTEKGWETWFEIHHLKKGGPYCA